MKKTLKLLFETGVLHLLMLCLVFALASTAFADDTFIVSACIASEPETIDPTMISSVDGNTYEVSGGTYGWSVDEAAEVEAIKNMLETKKSEKREPIWAGKSAVDAEIGEPDWGDTYIELNIATQHMYVIKDGEKVAEYDVVTGLPNGKRDTPTGVYYIMEKMQNKVLRGNRIEIA